MKQFVAKYGGSIFTNVIYLCISIYYVLGNTSFPSMDGASHVHNALLLKEYYFGNPIVLQNYELTSCVIPNIFSSYLLMALLVFFKSETATALFYVLHYYLFFTSFYYLLKSYKVKYAPLLSLVAVLFFNSFLFNLGFYNFSFSAVFLIFSIGIFHNLFEGDNRPEWRSYLKLLFMLLLLYYSNALSFLIFLAYLGLSEFVRSVVLIRSKSGTLSNYLNIALKLMLIVLPFLIMLMKFQSMFHFDSMAYFANPLSEYWKGLVDLKPFIVYVYDDERKFTHLVGYGLMALFVISIAYFIIKRKTQKLKGNMVLVLALLSLALYFIVPDNASVGMMSPRFLYFFFLFLIIWLVIQSTDVLKLPFVMMIATIAFMQYKKRHIPVIESLNADASLVKEVAKHIEPNSVVLTINYINNWLEPNFSNYLGVNKPLVLLANYEATVGWFPLKWNLKQIPKYTLGGKEEVAGAYYCINPKGVPKEIDYVFVFGDRSLVQSNLKLYELLQNQYTKVVIAENGLCSLYKSINKQP